MRRSVAAAVLVTLTLAGCGDTVVGAVPEEPPAPSTAPDGEGGKLVPTGYDGRFRVTAIVLEAPGEGPELCLGGVNESLPPQCGGPAVIGWDWDAVEAESAAGTTWGSYTVTGAFDGESFALTEPAAAPEPRTGEDPDAPDFSSPCPEPEGGWAPVDPELATQEASDQATTLAAASDGYGGAWIDQQVPDDEPTEANANDPANYVLNVTTTGDTAELERRLREVWGGSLCVSPALRTEAELRRIQDELVDEPGHLFSGVDIFSGTVELGVAVATEERQQELDEQHGTGVVRLVGQLDPLDRR